MTLKSVLSITVLSPVDRNLSLTSNFGDRKCLYIDTNLVQALEMHQVLLDRT